MKSLATHSASCNGYYLCLFIQTQFQLGSYYIHACTNETPSIANLQDLIPALALAVYVVYNYASICTCMDVTSYPARIVCMSRHNDAK